MLLAKSSEKSAALTGDKPRLSKSIAPHFRVVCPDAAVRAVGQVRFG